MRKLSILCLLLFCVSAYGQVSSQKARQIISDTGVPNAPCNPGPPWRSIYIRTADNSEYQCTALPNIWTKVSSGSPFTGGAFTTPLLGPDGTAAAPTFSFSSSGNSDNGMFLSSANALGFSTAGVERWIINSSGALNPLVNNTYDIGNGSVNPRDVNVARSVISPLIIGGTGTTSTLTLQSTSGVGASGADILFKVGNNGDNTALVVGVSGLIVASGTGLKYIDITSTTTGSTNEGGLRLTRGDAPDGYAQVSFKTGATANWAIGTRAASDDLQFFGNVAALTRFSISTAGVITLNTTNYNTCTGLTTASAVLTCTVSDERVKNSITPFGNGLDAIRKINPITFQFSEGTQWYKGGRAELGLSAQNLQAANPLLASLTGNENGLLQPEPMALHAVEIDAIKALDARVSELEKRLSVKPKRTRRRGLQ